MINLNQNLFSTCPSEIKEYITLLCLGDDFRNSHRISVISKEWNLCVTKVMTAYPDQLLEGLTIIDAKALGLEISDEPPIQIPTLLKMNHILTRHILNNAKCTLLTIPANMTIQKFLEIPIIKKGNIKADSHYLSYLDTSTRTTTGRIFITNATFEKSYNNTLPQKEEFVKTLNCQIPTAQELSFLCIASYSLFKKTLYPDPERGASTQIGFSSTECNAWPGAGIFHFVVGVKESGVGSEEQSALLYTDPINTNEALLFGAGGVYRF